MGLDPNSEQERTWSPALDDRERVCNPFWCEECLEKWDEAGVVLCDMTVRECPLTKNKSGTNHRAPRSGEASMNSFLVKRVMNHVTMNRIRLYCFQCHPVQIMTHSRVLKKRNPPIRTKCSSLSLLFWPFINLFRRQS